MFFSNTSSLFFGPQENINSSSPFCIEFNVYLWHIFNSGYLDGIFLSAPCSIGRRILCLTHHLIPWICYSTSKLMSLINVWLVSGLQFESNLLQVPCISFGQLLCDTVNKQIYTNVIVTSYVFWFRLPSERNWEL